MTKKNCICGICPGDCQVEIELIDGHIKNIKPSGEKKPSAICLRGLYSDEIVNSNDRLKKPLIRVGKKGEGKFREASWDEAIKYIGENFNRIIKSNGPHALMSHVGRGGFEYSTDDYVHVKSPGKAPGGFFSPIGSLNNSSVGSLCYVSYGVFAPITTMGFPATWLEPDIENTNLLVIWGTNPKTDSPPFKYDRILKAKRRGCKIIVIDHYKCDIAEIADLYIPIKSGTDGYFILSLLNYMFNNNMLDKEFLEKYTYGKKDFLEYIKDFSIGSCIKMTNISEDNFIKFAKLITNEPAALITYTGLEYSNSGVQTIRSLYTLWALSKNLDVKGGLLIKPKTKNMYDRVKTPNIKDMHLRMIGEKEFPLFIKLLSQPQFMMFPKAVLNKEPYEIKGLLNVGAAITNNYPNSGLFEKALLNLDFFVNVDRFLTKDSLYADVVLPATTYYEDESFVIYPDRVEKRERVIEPIGESKSNIYILQLIAEELGFGEQYPKNDQELLEFSFYNNPEILDALKKDGVYYFPKNSVEFQYEKYKKGLLTPDGIIGFPTPTGKFEIYSTLLKSYGYEPLPKYINAEEGQINTPDLYEKYPLILNTGSRIKSTFRTQHLNIQGLLDFQPKPEVLINPIDAFDRDISDGDCIEIYNSRGSIEMYAKVTDKIQKGDLEVNIGGGSPYQSKEWSKANVNSLTDNNNIDIISGFPCFKNLLCNVRKKQ